MLMLRDDSLPIHVWMCPRCGNSEPVLEEGEEPLECTCDLELLLHISEVIPSEEDLDTVLALYVLRSFVEDNETWTEQCHRFNLRREPLMKKKLVATDGLGKKVFVWVCPRCGRVAVVRDDDLGAKCGCTNEIHIMTCESEESVCSSNSLEIVRDNLETSGHVLIHEQAVRQ